MPADYYTLDQIPFSDLAGKLSIVPRLQGQRKRKNEVELINLICAFDIETSKITLPNLEGDEAVHSFMYIWQFQLGADYTIIGRTWEEYTELITQLTKIAHSVMNRFHLPSRPLFPVYVHNLSFEFMFLQGIYHFENEDCFFRDIRKPIYARYGNVIEYRCSYLHSNMTLAKWAENTGIEITKLDGRLFDYSKVRFPWTPLTDYEIQYCINDVRIIEKCIRAELDRDGDTLKSIPWTKTGYVRRDVKTALKPLYFSIQNLLPDKETYDLLRRCFRGGNTHANRWYVGKIVKDGHSKDIESSYPAVMMQCTFPMSAFQKIADEDTTIERISALINAGNAIIGDFTFKGLSLKNSRDAFPYIPLSKTHCLNYIEDNGRILTADLCTIALTEIDWMIIEKQYNYHTVKAANVRTARTGKLPAQMRNVVMKYYNGKTSLKGVKTAVYEYLKLKGLLNSTYGMMVQQMVHELIVYRQEGNAAGDVWHVQFPSDDEAEAELEKAPFPYQWGVYVTAWARFRLQKAIDLIPAPNGISNCIYVDTDSTKYIGDADFKSLNDELMKESIKAGSTAKDKNGNLHYMGIFTDEPDWKEFITLGAKRYAYIDQDGKLHTTVSGVTHQNHYYYKENEWDRRLSSQIEYDPDGDTPRWSCQFAVEELILKNPNVNPLKNFREGMRWDAAGGTDIIYHDQGEFDEFDYTDPETGKSVHITPSASIVNTSYTMTLERDYSDIIEDCMMWFRFIKERGYVGK